MRKATPEELQLLLIQLNNENKKLKNDVRFATERIEYWEDIASQQNECIVSQANRNDDLQTENDNLKTITKPDNNVRITELQAQLQAEKDKNKKLDKMLESYETYYKKATDTLRDTEDELKTLKSQYTKIYKALSISEANSSLFLKELSKYRTEKRNFQDEIRTKRTKTDTYTKIQKQEKQDRETYQDEENFRPIKSIKVTFDKIGNYCINN